MISDCFRGHEITAGVFEVVHITIGNRMFYIQYDAASSCFFRGGGLCFVVVVWYILYCYIVYIYHVLLLFFLCYFN